MKLRNKLSKLAAFAAVAGASVVAYAKPLDSTDTFYTFYSTVNGWAGGGLGAGLATTMLVMGGAIGVAKNSPMPALTGIAGAAFLHWGPNIISSILLAGAAF